ncbi:unnamed protein product [Ceratitis capitata]|uniref:(Mediterranean fruit fly) hypothetical protein n=1 Tax=Ceratitis capitata TaxID=7213 RepID=A0A811U130_CERCA|nr:unnamed protein product [Ceratitis capitata]
MSTTKFANSTDYAMSDSFHKRSFYHCSNDDALEDSLCYKQLLDGTTGEEFQMVRGDHPECYEGSLFERFGSSKLVERGGIPWSTWNSSKHAMVQAGE